MTKIYLDYDQAALDAQYDQTTLVPDISDYTARWRAGTETAKQRFRNKERVAYGDHPDMWLDVYHPETAGNAPAPILVFFHGGAWRMPQVGQTGHGAHTYAAVGALYCPVNFSVAPEARLDEMLDQCRAAVAFLHREGARFGGDPARIHLLGHSSGAHLAATTAVTSGDIVKGVAVTSGPYDLVPVRLSARNTYLHLDEAAAARNTPQTHLGPGAPSAVIAWGGQELPEFQRQGRALADAWEAATGSVTRIEFPHNNHFDMGDEIVRPHGHFTLSLLAQMEPEEG